MGKANLPFKRLRTNESEPSRFEKASAIATIIATLVSIAALIVSIIVMLDTRDQANDQSKAQKLDKQQQSIERESSLRREDSLAKLHDSMSKAQLSIMESQRAIIEKQQNFQQLSYIFDLNKTKPVFKISMREFTYDSSTQLYSQFGAIHNVGGREAINCVVDNFQIKEFDSVYYEYADDPVNVCYPLDSVEVGYAMPNPFPNDDNKYQLPYYIIFRLSYEDPISEKNNEEKFGVRIGKDNGKIFINPMHSFDFYMAERQIKSAHHLPD